MNNLTILSITVLLFLISCKNNNNKQLIDTSKGDIVLIFEKMPENWQIKTDNGWITSKNKSDIEYFTQNYNLITYIVQDSTKIDTLIIKDVNKSIELIHTYKALDKFSYLLKPNDTVYFTYKGTKPIAKLLNKREYKKFDLNYDYYIREKKIIQEDFPCILKQKESTSFLFINFSIGLTKEKIKNFCNQKRKIAKNELESEKKFLDSIYQLKQISNDVYNLYKKRIEYNIQSILVSENSNQKLFNKHDSLLKYSFYRDYLRNISEYKIEKIVAKSDDSNLFFADSKIVLDSILSSSIFNTNEKKLLIQDYLNVIYNNSSFEETKLSYKKIIDLFKTDSSFIKILNEKYKLDEGYSLQLEIADHMKKANTFENIIKEKKGYVLYVDFWASWCSPCRTNIKNSKKLKEIYKSEKLKFIYLDLNDTYGVWEKAKKELSIENEENYLIKNYKSSKLINEFNVTTIPRYFIIDKNGKLVNANAPRPDSKEIIKELNKYLKK